MIKQIELYILRMGSLLHVNYPSIMLCENESTLYLWFYSTTPSSDLRIKAGADADTLATIALI